MRYEYRVGKPREASPGTGDKRPRIHDSSQKSLYFRLGDFLAERPRESGVRYPEGHPVIRFSLSNEGEKTVYLSSVRLYLLTGGRLGVHVGGRSSAKCSGTEHSGARRLGEKHFWGERLMVDLLRERVLPGELATSTANILGPVEAVREPVEIIPGDAVGYRFSLVRLADTIKNEGYEGNLRLVLEATDRVGTVYRRTFRVDTYLWASET